MFRKDVVIRVMEPKVLRALLTMLFIYGTNVEDDTQVTNFIIELILKINSIFFFSNRHSFLNN